MRLQTKKAELLRIWQSGYLEISIQRKTRCRQDP